MNGTDRPLLALLIDADNVSSKYADALLEEATSLGEISIRRIYGDFSKGSIQGWDQQKLANLAIQPHQQFANTKGKNASDIAMVIDAMDILHSGRFSGFVIVASDGDYTRLASRIREQGLDVYGMGEKKTPVPFRNACKRFIFLENLLEAPDSSQGAEGAEKPVKKEPPTKAGPILLKAMDSIDQDDEWYHLGKLGQVVIAAHPEFDPRTYGCKKLGELVQKIPNLDVKRVENAPYVRRKP